MSAQPASARLRAGIVLALGALLLAAAAPAAAESAAPPRPNVVFIIADDLGWADVGFHGGRTPTPNLDRLAGAGVELSRHYVYPVCSPTRAALLTGRYATRFGVVNPQNPRALPWETLTLARALGSAGYDTAICGKWHLGSKPEWGPAQYGFDHGYGSLAGGVGPWDHRYKKGDFTRTWHRNGELIEEEGHVTDLIAREAVRWIESRGERPFFLYVPFTAVHIPIREPEEYLDRVPAEITEPSLREYAACILHLDDAVGRILTALERAGKADDTLVVFTSDNGGTTARNDDPQYPADGYTPGRAGGDNRPLRGAKGNLYEGGIRVPAVVRWPSHLEPGKLAAPVHVADWMPTLCALAGYRPESDPRWDGRDLRPLLAGAESAEKPAPRPLYIAAPNFRARTLIHGDWKLIAHEPGGKDSPAKVELFDLARDPREENDFAAREPARVAELEKLLAEASRSDRDAVAGTGETP